MDKKLTSLLSIVICIGLIGLSPLFSNTSPRVLAATPRVNLLTTDNFAVLGGSQVSDTGTTTIIGDVGLSPTGGATITGLTCSEVTGTIYDTDAGYTGGGGGSTSCLVTNAGLLTTAQNDLTTAYTDASNRTPSPDIGTELGGTTLTDGVYHAASGTFGLTGTVTLNGQGNADSVFIFQMASTLITASSSRVVLINGAQPCNVYWQVGSAATLGTGSTFVGNILAMTAITDDGGSNINGRLLARTGGAITLNNTTVTKQTCSSGGSSSLSNANSGGSSRMCPTLNYITPIIIASNRIDADSVSLSWGPYSGISTFIVQYGLTNGDWIYSTNVTGFSATLNDLPLNQPIWVRVATTDGCSVGTYGESMLIGGPQLPNTGYAPQKTVPVMHVLGSIFVGIISLYFFIKRYYIFSKTIDYK